MQLKKLLKLTYAWKFSVFLSYFALVWYLTILSKKVSYQQVNPPNSSKIVVSLDFCYKLSIREEKCNPSYSTQPRDKLDFPTDANCTFEDSIECYTKGFKNMKIGEIISKFKKCQIHRLIEIDRPSNISYKIYFGHICVKHRLEIDFRNGDETINIYPKQKNQIFLITVSSKREYEGENTFRSPIINVFRRFCWMDPYPPNPNVTTEYHCSEDDKEIKFKLDYFSVKSLKAPFESNCIDRPEGNESTQVKCYENCVKKEKPHFFMTFREEDEDVHLDQKFIFDNATVMDPLVEKCLDECRQEDCNYGSFDVANILNDPGAGLISLIITSTDHRTDAIPMISGLTLIYCAIVFVYLFFGLNIYEYLFKKLLLRSHFNQLKKKKKREKQSYKLTIYLLITFLISLAVGFLIEKYLFKFGKETRKVIIKRESTNEINVSTSICFNLTNILKSSNNQTEEELRNMTLKELESITWSVEDFKKRGSMKNSVGPVPIRHKEKEIFVFYRNFKKCFLIYYETKQLFPHIYLQRKSHIFFNVNEVNFTYFYVEENFKYPQLNAPFFMNSSLFTLRQNDFKNDECRKYNEKTFKCLCKDDCIQNCILDKYQEDSKDSKELPIFINIKEKDFKGLEDFKFNNDTLIYEKYLAECELKYPRIECDSVNITIRPKMLTKDDHNISINLTPNNIVMTELRDEGRLLVFNRILGFLITLTGFAVKEFFDELVLIYLIFFPPLLNIRLTKRIASLLIFFLFSINFYFLYNHIIKSDMVQISYKNSLSIVSLPKIRFCYEMTEVNLNYNNYTKKDLDELTLSMSQFFIGMNYLDDDFNTHFIAINENETDQFTTQTFYLDDLKCFSVAVKGNVPVASVNRLRIDQLITIFINLTLVENKRFLVYLNVENTIDLEWSTFLHANQFYNLYFSTKEFWYNDDYYYLKNFTSSIKSFLNIVEEANTQKDYFYYLRKNYNDEQFVTTTIIPLETDPRELTIKNDQFNAFIEFRSIDGDKNAWDFTHNNEIPRFSYDLYKETPEKRAEDIVNKSIVAFRPNLSCLRNRIKNKYHFVEFFLHLFILTAFWFKLNLFNLPESLQAAYPVAKFFINLFLYIIVCTLIFIFDIVFKFFSFFK